MRRDLEFDEIYAAQYAQVVRTAALITGSRAAGEELAQETFLQLFRRFETIEHPIGWLRVAIVNGCRSWQRRQILERRVRHDPPLVAVDPDGLAVREALSVLSSRQRAAVVLRFFSDLSEADIAEALGCRPGTVKSLLSRSMTRLKEVLDDRPADDVAPRAPLAR